MAPTPLPEATIELDYPLYALDFDPQDATRIVVGGGGGAGRSGVGNKITILETSSSTSTPTRTELRKAGELQLSRDEDSVMSVAFGPHEGRTTSVYAGVNSGPESVARGVNEHLRILRVEPQSKSVAALGGNSEATSPVRISEVSRTAMFAHPDEDTYQRVLRVAGRMGAASTAMGKKPQLVVFETASSSSSSSSSSEPTVRKLVELPREVEDLDIIQTGPDRFQVAFCYKYELHVIDVGEDGADTATADPEPELVYTMPSDVPERPAFRSLRYLSPQFVLAASNLPRRRGVVLQALRLPSPRNKGTRLAATAKVSRAISVTAMAVTNLSPPADPLHPLGDTQFAIAVAGNDSSLSLYTLEHKMADDLTLLADLHPTRTIKETHHGGNITALAFSTFSTPKTHLRPQYIKLASTSLQRSVASKGPSSIRLILVMAAVALILAALGQATLEMLGKSEPVVHVHRVLPSWYKVPGAKVANGSIAEDDFAAKLLGDGVTGGEGRAVVVALKTRKKDEQDGERDGGDDIRVDVHQPEVHGLTRSWGDLDEEQRERWRVALSEAGLWRRDMGEGVLGSIMFGVEESEDDSEGRTDVKDEL
ncbi:prolactin regulatory element-binding protein [Geosmithia morbida]|uniref:Guanine nucleotide-exchange factor SEC12 n=1 Tax=Geosmithia morbida TaxID=1094350 RepID=A0A9P4YP55_9HYPO|nr:prolactin regulatory element-binding protein [Geosmithia morbida]XP_035317894.1 prolactin regulatory element-binding protein [Geosmithia morbida]KAF4119241.1 prolactin regulatory element-binding protein [Geosmithia morbida]KAF4119242.1 prolactin regulatory element-binding protein [Geosmithia morbida]